MSEEKTYTESEADLYFAKRFNGKTWELLEKPDRTKQEDELMMITAKGIIIRTGLDEIRSIGRNTQGVRLIKLDTGDKLCAAEKIVAEDESEEEG